MSYNVPTFRKKYKVNEPCVKSGCYEDLGPKNCWNFRLRTTAAAGSAAPSLSGSTLYGTTYSGGSLNEGVVFSLSLASLIGPPLTIALSGANIILTWPANVTGFTLQFTTNLVSPVWSTVSPPPVVANGQYTVTNSISSAQQFYRLTN
jgi:uncharacterized repeat protein (TIGR03803 family)